MERQLLYARTKVEQAQIELSDGSGDSGDSSTRSTNLPSLPRQTLQETVGRYLALCDEDRSIPVPPRLFSLKGTSQTRAFLIDPKE